MRFPHLKIGQQFEYQGKRYTKTGPLTAAEEETGASAMIRRSAEVVLSENKTAEIPAEPVKQNYTRQEMLDLFQANKASLDSQLREMASDDGGLELEPVLKVIDTTLSFS